MILSNHSHSHREIVKGKTIYVYINGDLFFEAKPIVVHKKSDRTFESLLNRLTDILNPRFGAVRHLKAVDGSLEVASLDALESGASYVAYGRKFTALDYADISSRLKAFAHPEPLLSPREFRKLVVSGRARKIVRHPLLIYVYPNGEPLASAKKVLLQPWIHKTWDNVLEQIAAKVPLKRTRPITKVYELNTKMPVTCGADLQDQHLYVACGNEKFKKDMEYGLSPTIFTHKQQMAKRYPTLPPIEPHEAKHKPNSSAPAEKSKQELHPQPPPSKRTDNGEAPEEKEGVIDTRVIKSRKLRTPSPENSQAVEDDRRKGPPTNSERNHRVSPILEQKTPSSTATGVKEEEREQSFTDHQQKEKLDDPVTKQTTADTKQTEPTIEEETTKHESEAENEPKRDPDALETDDNTQTAESEPLESKQQTAAEQPQAADQGEPTTKPGAEENQDTDGPDMRGEETDLEDSTVAAQSAPTEEVGDGRKEGDGEATTEEKVAETNTADNKLADDQPINEQPVEDQSAGKQLAGDQPASDQPPSDQPASEHAVSDRPASDQPSTDQPAEEADGNAAVNSNPADAKSTDDEKAKDANDDNNTDENNQPINPPAETPSAEASPAEAPPAEAPPAEDSKEDSNNNNGTSTAPQAAPVETQG